MGGRLIIGLAGHIDHGKSALVTALTGKSVDRLPEERRRGITVDLNFAALPLSGGIAGVVDVPGHEDFVRTMVAGASGTDLVLLVIAADEGIKPQTLEHLVVLEQLRVPAGIPVLTKSDLVTTEELERLLSAVAVRLATSPVEFARPIPVSSRTGEGIEALRSIIEARAGRLGSRPPEDLFRLPVDRAFSVAGVGTVITGSAWSGVVSVGDSVTLLPMGLHGRVRSVEAHGRPLRRSETRTRIAVGLAGIRRDGISRGAVLVANGAPWPVTTALDVAIALEPGAPRALDSRTRIRVLIGTAEVMARVHPRGRIEPGSSGLARLTLERAVVARGGDRFVVRSYSPVATIGGGQVLDPDPPRRAVWPDGLAAEEPDARLLALLGRRPGGIATGTLPILLGIAPLAASAAAQRAVGARLLRDRWIIAATVEAVADRVLAVVSDHHAARRGSGGVQLETLRRTFRHAEGVIAAAIDDLVEAGRLQVADGVASLPGFVPRIEGGESGVAMLVRLVDEGGLTPPTLAELGAQTGHGDVAGAVRLAAERGLVKAVERDRYYSCRALDLFTAALLDAGRAGTISPASLRDRLGVSRKYLIPLLEWADRQGITVRVPEGRRLKASP